MVAILNDRTREQVRGVLKDMTGAVKLVFFEQTLGCETCPDARALLEELATLSDKLSLELLNLQIDREKAALFRVDAVPALAVVGGKDFGIRFYGVPAGYEFSTLLDAILDVSNARTSLSPATIESLGKLATPVHLRVFVTPT
jgi:alkyl hydroperoxide reductase subunit AhpF